MEENSSSGCGGAELGTEQDMLSELSLICSYVMNVLCLVGVGCNVISLYIFTQPAFNKRSINVLLAALSASDLVVCVLAIPVFSNTQLQELFPGAERHVAALMIYLYPVTLIFQTMSVWLLVAITIDRYLAVCHPLDVRRYCTRSRALAVICVIFSFSVAYNFVRFWEFRLDENGSLQGQLRDNALYMLLYQNILTLLTQFVLPLFVLCFFNFLVARTILQAVEQRRSLVSSERREHSTAKMMLFVVLVFMFCYTFSFVLNVTEIVNKDLFSEPFGYLLNDINNILIVVNSSTSIIFYTKYSTRYRMQLSRMCPVARLCILSPFVLSEQEKNAGGLLHSDYSTTPAAANSSTSALNGNGNGTGAKLLHPPPRVIERRTTSHGFVGIRDDHRQESDDDCRARLLAPVHARRASEVSIRSNSQQTTTILLSPDC